MAVVSPFRLWCGSVSLRDWVAAELYVTNFDTNTVTVIS
jgi:hypothetical protein